MNPRGSQRHHEPLNAPDTTVVWLNCDHGDSNTQECARHYKHIEPIYSRHAFALVEYYPKRRAEMFASAAGRRARALGYLCSTI